MRLDTVRSSSNLVPRIFSNDDIGLVWEEIKPMLQRCVDVSQGMIKLEDIEQGIVSGQVALFTVALDNRITAVFAVRIVSYGVYNAARIIACAGKDLMAALDHVHVLEGWALTHGAVEIEGWCRPSMARLTKRFGFETKVHIVTRDLRSKLQ